MPESHRPKNVKPKQTKEPKTNRRKQKLRSKEEVVSIKAKKIQRRKEKMNTQAGTNYGPLLQLKGKHLHVLRNKGKKKGTRFCKSKSSHAPNKPHRGPRNKSKKRQ